MKNIYFVVAFTVLTVNAAVAQKTERIELTPGTTTIEALNGDIYIYPGFQNGVVAFKNGRSGKSKLNYCFLTNEMLFINARGDTLALTGENEINYLSIGTDTFYFDGTRFLKQEKNYNWIRTASFLTIKEINRKKKGGYGETIMGAATDYNSVSVSQLLYAVKSSDYVTMLKETSYYIADGSGQYTPLKKESFLKLVPAKKLPAVKEHLKKNNVDFGNIDQVDSLVKWINDLQ
jgi:hypothetical protein